MGQPVLAESPDARLLRLNPDKSIAYAFSIKAGGAPDAPPGLLLGGVNELNESSVISPHCLPRLGLKRIPVPPSLSVASLNNAIGYYAPEEFVTLRLACRDIGLDTVELNICVGPANWPDERELLLGGSLLRKLASDNYEIVYAVDKQTAASEETPSSVFEEANDALLGEQVTNGGETGLTNGYEDENDLASTMSAPQPRICADCHRPIRPPAGIGVLPTTTSRARVEKRSPGGLLPPTEDHNHRDHDASDAAI